MVLHSRLPAINTTTPKKLSTTIPTITMRIISKSLTPFESYIHTTTEEMMKRPATQRYLPEEDPSVSVRMPRFCWSAAAPSENWGMAQTRLAMSAAISQPQPRTGLMCLLIA